MKLVPEKKTSSDEKCCEQKLPDKLHEFKKNKQEKKSGDYENNFLHVILRMDSRRM
jgi:hypothetical protein